MGDEVSLFPSGTFFFFSFCCVSVSNGFLLILALMGENWDGLCVIPGVVLLISFRGVFPLLFRFHVFSPDNLADCHPSSRFYISSH